MDKQQILSFIEEQIKSGKISSGDLQSLPSISGGLTTTPSHTDTTESSGGGNKIVHVLYAIGIIIVLIGVIVLLSQFWDTIGFGGRLLVTLILGFVGYVTGVVLHKDTDRVISQVMFALSAALIPFGIFVLLSEYDVKMTTNLQILMSGGLGIMYAIAYFMTKRNLLPLLSVGFLSSSYFSLIAKLDNSVFDFNIYKWALFLLGIVYILIGYAYRYAIAHSNQEYDKKEKHAIQNIFYSLGTIGVLGASLATDGLFELVTILLVFATLYASVFLKSRNMLVIGSLFLVGDIIKLTAKYFVNSIGWPLALIGVGLMVIAIGYMTIYINRTYINKKA